MKIVTRRHPRQFAAPTVLKGDTPFLGATVEQWDKALTGNMAETMVKVRARVQSNAPKRDVSKATTFDLASSIGKRLKAA